MIFGTCTHLYSSIVIAAICAFTYSSSAIARVGACTIEAVKAEHCMCIYVQANLAESTSTLNQRPLKNIPMKISGENFAMNKSTGEGETV